MKLVAFGENNLSFKPEFGEVVKIAKNFEVHKITIASDLTAGYNSLLTGNEFTKNHLTDEGFYIQLISLTTRSVGTSAVGYAFHGNRAYMQTKTPTDIYGVTQVVSAASFIANVVTVDVQTSGTHIYATGSGDVKMQCNSNVALPAGDYILILGVAEV